MKYFILEDGDIEFNPNIFYVDRHPANEHSTNFSPRLRDIKHAFPLYGKYLWRFKSPLILGTDREKHAVSVWRDCCRDEDHVSVWRGEIIAKVTRISLEEAEIPVTESGVREAATENSDYVSAPSSIPVISTGMARAPGPAAEVTLTTTPAPLLDVEMFHKQHQPSLAKKSKHPMHISPPTVLTIHQEHITGTLIDVGGDPYPLPMDVSNRSGSVSSGTGTAEASLLDMDTPISNQEQPSQNSDLLTTMRMHPVNHQDKLSQSPMRMHHAPIPTARHIQPPVSDMGKLSMNTIQHPHVHSSPSTQAQAKVKTGPSSGNQMKLSMHKPTNTSAFGDLEWK